MKLSGAKNGATQIELNPVNGDLIINGNVYNDNNKPFHVFGANSKLLTISVGLTGNGTVSLTIDQYSKVKLTAAQSWGDSTHGVNINQGEFWMDSGGSLASSSVPITVGLTDGNTAKLWLSLLTGGLTLNNNITVNNQSPSPSEKTIGGLNTSGTSTFGGTVTLNGQVNLSAATGGTVAFNGVISGASQNVVINGYGLPLTGIITMNAANTYSGNTYISGGTLQFNSGGSAASSPNFYLGETSGGQTATLALGVTSGGQTLNNPITVRSGSSGSKAISGLATSSSSTLGGNIALNDNLTVSSASGGNLILGGIISGSGKTITKTGGGALTLTGVNTYTGGNTVSGGTLLVNNSTGSGTGSGSVSVNSAATLGGNGTISGATMLGSGSSGTLSPGSAGLGTIGTLSFGSTLTLGSSSAANFEINKAAGPVLTADKAAVTGAVAYGGALTVTATGNALAAGDSFTLFTGSGFSGWFSSVALPLLTAGISWDTNNLRASGYVDIYAFTATLLTLSTPKNTAAVITVAKLANHASSGRGTPVVTSATTPSHGTASVSNGVLTYTPTTNYTGSDSFTATFNDGHGWQTMAVSVTVGNGTGQSPNVLATGTKTVDSVNNFFANFAGIPGTTYTVEKSTSLETPVWTKLGNYTAPTDNTIYGLGIGVFQVLDPVSNGSGYYRTVSPSY